LAVCNFYQEMKMMFLIQVYDRIAGQMVGGTEV